jgi:TetR/AcrR family transcriptional repressor for divergent bdcA
VLEEAARRYALDPANPGSAAAGCLTIEGTRCNDPEAREAARALTAAAENAIRRFVAATHPEAAEQMTDYVVILMVGLSTMARSGHDVHRLLATARFAALGYRTGAPCLSSSPSHPSNLSCRIADEVWPVG